MCITIISAVNFSLCLLAVSLELGTSMSRFLIILFILCLFIFLCIYLSTSLSVIQYISPYVCLYVYLSTTISVSIYPSIITSYPSVHTSPSSRLLLTALPLPRQSAGTPLSMFSFPGPDGDLQPSTQELIDRQGQDFVDERLAEFQAQIHQLQGEY